MQKYKVRTFNAEVQSKDFNMTSFLMIYPLNAEVRIKRKNVHYTFNNEEIKLGKFELNSYIS